MEKYLGEITAKASKRNYEVKWDMDDQTAWIKIDSETWKLVCNKVNSEKAAITCAKNYVDSQPNIY